MFVIKTMGFEQRGHFVHAFNNVRDNETSYRT